MDAVRIRFWKKVLKTKTCWFWKGRTCKQGYGWFDIKKIPKPAHRVAYQFTKGKIRKGFEIDHLCRVRHCINPEHLEAVTHKTNMKRSEKAQRTHCIHGHEFTKENTRKKDNGTRGCKKCHAIRALKKYWANK